MVSTPPNTAPIQLTVFADPLPKKLYVDAQTPQGQVAPQPSQSGTYDY